MSPSCCQTASAACGVALGVGVDHRLELAQRHQAHVVEAGQQLLRRELALHRQNALGDVLHEVADALEVVGDADRRDDVAQVHRHRLAARDGEDRLLLHLALELVEPGVGWR